MAWALWIQPEHQESKKSCSSLRDCKIVPRVLYGVPQYVFVEIVQLNIVSVLRSISVSDAGPQVVGRSSLGKQMPWRGKTLSVNGVPDGVWCLRPSVHYPGNKKALVFARV